MADGEHAFANHPYVWENVPAQFRGWQFTQTSGGERAQLCVKAKHDAMLYVVTSAAQKKFILKDWAALPAGKFHYTDKDKTPMTICARAAKTGEEIVVPQGKWSGTLLLLPPDGFK